MTKILKLLILVSIAITMPSKNAPVAIVSIIVVKNANHHIIKLISSSASHHLELKKYLAREKVWLLTNTSR